MVQVLPLPVDEAELAGNFVESVLWGMYLITCVSTARILFRTGTRWKRLDELNWIMVIAGTLLLIIATLDVILGFYHNIKAFIVMKGGEAAIEEFSDISQWINVMRSVTVVLQSAIGDSVLIYRCYVVYNRSWKIIIPSVVLFIGSLFLTIYVIYLEATLHSRLTLNIPQLAPYGTAFWVLTTVQNLLTTSLLIYRIWQVDRENARYVATNRSSASSASKETQLHYIMRVIAESGALYTIMSTITFIVEIIGSNALYITTDIEIIIVGITFNLLVIRASKRIDSRNSSNYQVGSTTYPLRVVPGSPSNASGYTGYTGKSGSTVVDNVMITQEVETDVKRDSMYV